jgi:two-component system response regulator AtoC
MTIRTLIIEDEELIRWSLRQKFQARDYRVEEAATGAAAVAALDRSAYDLILLDYRLPDMTGLDVLRRLRERDGDTVVIMMTAYSTIESAVEAIKLGAFDYIPKPFQIEELLRIVDKALETTRLRREVRELRRQLESEYGGATLVGQHPSMRKMLEVIQQVAASVATTVLVRGETGTGKDLVARVIHNSSDRASRPFINITCTALSETLLESELFGHERGAFTDAKAQKKGLLEIADGGTVFLDEIGDMLPGLQAKLLRFLEERRFRRVGGTQEIAVDVRVIAATNRDMNQSIKEGKFREDLFYRLNVVSIDIPPLRARGDDVIVLAQHFAERFSREFKKPIASLDETAVARLRRHGWPGNVRELRNAMERAVLLCREATIRAEDIAVGGSDVSGSPTDLEHFVLPEEGFDLARLTELEGRLLRQALERTNNNQVRAARLLHLSRDRLRYRLHKHGLLGNSPADSLSPPG